MAGLLLALLLLLGAVAAVLDSDRPWWYRLLYVYAVALFTQATISRVRLLVSRTRPPV